MALAPGNLWSESGRGTNAIGTALAIDDGCEIDGRQHFLTRNQNLYCAAMPLQRPDGSIAGVLDISGPANFPHQHTFGWVKAAAKQIEYLWVKQSLHPEQWLMSLHRQVDKLDSVEELLLVFSDNVLTAGNRLAMREFGLSAAQFGQLTFASLFPTLTQTAVSVPLPLTTPQGRYHYRLRDPTRRRVAVSAPPAMHLPLPVRAKAKSCCDCSTPASPCALKEKPAAAKSMSAARCTGTAAGAAVNLSPLTAPPFRNR